MLKDSKHVGKILKIKPNKSEHNSISNNIVRFC